MCVYIYMGTRLSPPPLCFCNPRNIAWNVEYGIEKCCTKHTPCSYNFRSICMKCGMWKWDKRFHETQNKTNKETKGLTMEWSKAPPQKTTNEQSILRDDSVGEEGAHGFCMQSNDMYNNFVFFVVFERVVCYSPSHARWFLWFGGFLWFWDSVGLH